VTFVSFTSGSKGGLSSFFIVYGGGGEREKRHFNLEHIVGDKKDMGPKGEKWEGKLIPRPNDEIKRESKENMGSIQNANATCSGLGGGSVLLKRGKRG